MRSLHLALLSFVLIVAIFKISRLDDRIAKLEQAIAVLNRTELQAHGVWTIRSFDPTNRAVTNFCMTDGELHHVDAAAFPMTWSNMDGAGFSNVPVGDKAWSGTFGLECSAANFELTPREVK